MNYNEINEYVSDICAVEPPLPRVMAGRKGAQIINLFTYLLIVDLYERKIIM